MPYIQNEKRKDYDQLVAQLVRKLCDEEEDNVLGILNYFIYATLLRYLHKKGYRYHRIASLLGTLECCKQEFYRRVGGWYEDMAIERNGDIPIRERKELPPMWKWYSGRLAERK